MAEGVVLRSLFQNLRKQIISNVMAFGPVSVVAPSLPFHNITQLIRQWWLHGLIVKIIH